MSETLDAPAIIEDAPVSAPAEPASIRDTMAAVLAKYPDRGDNGRFESRAVAEDEPHDTTPDQPAQPEAEPAPPAIAPPDAWSAEHKAKWDTLPPDVREYIAQREGEAHKAISEKGSRAALYDAVEAAIGDHKTALISEYGSVDRAVNTLVNIAMEAGRRPQDFVKWFAQQHRIDLNSLAQPDGNPATPVDPTIAHLSQTVGTLQTQIQQQNEERLAATIREFSEAKDASGKPLRPHFDAVREDMAVLMTSGKVTSLAAAYDKATRMNDAVWAKIEADRDAARQAAEMAKQAKAAADARKAASVNIKPLGSVAGSPVRGQTMRETMAAVHSRLMGQG